MRKDINFKSYTAAEIKARRAESRTDLNKVDAMTMKNPPHPGEIIRDLCIKPLYDSNRPYPRPWSQ